MGSSDPAASGGNGQTTEAFAEQALTDLGATMITLLCSYGDRYGLFKVLAERGSLTPEELAEATGTHPRYVAEWARALTCGGYLTRDPSTDRFALPATHVPVLAEEGGEAFLGGFYQIVGAMVSVYPEVAEAFARGGGVRGEDFPEDLWIGEERANNAWHENLLVNDWIPRLPAVQAKLERGAEVLDVGCGHGRALVNMAKAYPESRFTGIDILESAVARARAHAEAEGVSDRVRFAQHDLADGIPGTFDLITALDVVHDVQDPPRLLRDARAALRPGGRMMIMEINVADELEEDVGPIGALLYGISPFYCMTISLAREGMGYGTAGLPPGRLRALAEAGGFRTIQRVEVDNPIQVLYDLEA